MFIYGNRLHPIWRAALYLVAMLAAEVVSSILLGIAYGFVILFSGGAAEDELMAMASGDLPQGLLLGAGALRLASTLFLALVLGRWLDREPPETMGMEWRRWGRDALLGSGLGLVTMFSVGGIMLLTKLARVSPGPASVASFVAEALVLVPMALAEEVAFRGYLQRVFSSWRGPVVSTVVTSILFSLFHIINPNLNLIGLVNIFLAGVVFALAVEWTGTLWLASGYHFLWNLAQGPLLGMPVSGSTWTGVLTTQVTGPALWTGGAFGPEGGLLATLVLLISILPLRLLTRRPASVSAACRRQRAVLEARYGPLPHTHFRLEIDESLFADLKSAAARDRMGEVVLVPRRSDGRLLLHTKTFYPQAVYRLPSGGIKPGERVTAAVQRELAEETSLEAGEVWPLGLLTYALKYGRQSLFFHSWIVLIDTEGDPVPNDANERIAGFEWVERGALAEAADQLRALPPEWMGWGRFRAAGHDAAARWLSS